VQSALPRGVISNAIAATSTTLVIAAPATPQSLDCNFDVSLGTFEAIAALYDNLLEFKKIPDPKQAGARSREDIADHPDMPARYRRPGQVSRSRSSSIQPANLSDFSCVRASRATGGNELTAERNVKMGRGTASFGLGRNRRPSICLRSVLRIKKASRSRGKYTVSINS